MKRPTTTSEDQSFAKVFQQNVNIDSGNHIMERKEEGGETMKNNRRKHAWRIVLYYVPQNQIVKYMVEFQRGMNIENSYYPTPSSLRRVLGLIERKQ